MLPANANDSAGSPAASAGGFADGLPTAIAGLSGTPEMAIEAKIDRLEELVSRYFDGDLCEPEVTELEGLVAVDDANLRVYLDHAMLHADLIDFFRTDNAESADA